MRRLSPPVRHRRAAPLRRAGTAIAALVVAWSLAVGLLVFVTPSANMAASLVATQARLHGIAYPGPDPPRRFSEALLATEDHRFYSPFDPGIDPLAVGRVILGRLTGHRDQGGSTIEQQLAKMLYTPGQSGLLVEIEQLALAVKLDLAYRKARILAMYSETAYYGDGYYGLAAASCGYFGRQPWELSWAQAAVLAGVVNAPSADDPRTHPNTAHAREAHVFSRLVAVGGLREGEARAALSHSIGLVSRQEGTRIPICSPERHSLRTSAR